VNRSTKTVHVEGFEQAVAVILAKPSQSEELVRGMRMARHAITVMTIPQVFSYLDEIYPETSVAVGDTWTASYSVSGLGKSSGVQPQYTVTKIDDQFVWAELKSDINFQDTKPLAGGASMKIRKTGAMTGPVRFALHTGALTDLKITQEIDGATQMSFQGKNNTPTKDKLIQTITLKIR
jgi:Family of unknown function (DUF6263)